MGLLNAAIAYGRRTSLGELLTVAETTVRFRENYFPDISGANVCCDVVLTTTGSYISDNPANYETITLTSYNGLVGGLHNYTCIRGVEGTQQEFAIDSVAACLITAKGWTRLTDYILDVEDNMISNHSELSGVGANDHHNRQHSISGASDHSSMTANRLIGRAGTAGTPSQLTAEVVRGILNVENGANNYSHPVDIQCSHGHAGEDITSGFISIDRGRDCNDLSTGLLKYNGPTRSPGILYNGSDNAPDPDHTVTLAYSGLFWTSRLRVESDAALHSAGLSSFNRFYIGNPTGETLYGDASDTVRTTDKWPLELKINSTTNNHATGMLFTVGASTAYTGAAAIGARRVGAWGRGSMFFAVNESGGSDNPSMPVAMEIHGPDGKIRALNDFEFEAIGGKSLLTETDSWKLENRIVTDEDTAIIDLAIPNLTQNNRIKVEIISKDGHGSGPMIQMYPDALDFDSSYRTSIIYKYWLASESINVMRTLVVERSQIGAFLNNGLVNIEVELWRDLNDRICWRSFESRRTVDHSEQSMSIYSGSRTITTAAITSLRFATHLDDGFEEGTRVNLWVRTE